jgi:hypothetical protein
MACHLSFPLSECRTPGKIPELGISEQCIYLSREMIMNHYPIRSLHTREEKKLFLGKFDIMKLCRLFDCTLTGLVLHLEDIEITHPESGKKMVIGKGEIDTIEMNAVFDLNWKD